MKEHKKEHKKKEKKKAPMMPMKHSKEDLHEAHKHMKMYAR
jgi:hypothetical protein